MIIKYKIIVGGYKHATMDDKSSAMQEANRLSYSYDKVIVRPVKGNGQPFPMADDIVVSQGSVSFKPKCIINGVNVAI